MAKAIGQRDKAAAGVAGDVANANANADAAAVGKSFLFFKFALNSSYSSASGSGYRFSTGLLCFPFSSFPPSLASVLHLLLQLFLLLVLLFVLFLLRLVLLLVLFLLPLCCLIGRVLPPKIGRASLAATFCTHFARTSK